VALPLANPIPTLTSLEPSSATAGGAAFTLTVNGTGFVNGATVKWAGTSRTTSFVNDTQLTASIPASDIASAGLVNITVANPGPGGGASTNALPFTITTPSQNPVPSLQELIPSGADAGGPAFTLTVEGSNFIPQSKVRWNGLDRTTTYISGSQLQATIGTADIAQAGPAGVTVFNPGPGGGTSNALPFIVAAPGQNPRPSITSLAPPSSTAGSVTGAGLTLTINGVGFIEDSQAQWNGEDRPTSFVSSTQLKLTLTAGDLSAAGKNSVTVVNPGPGGGTSNTATFTVSQPGTNPIPSLTGYSLTAGGATITLLIQGTNFINGSTLLWNGTPRPTSFVSSTQLRVTLPAVQVTQGGPASLTVVNPAPGGGTSNTLLFRLAKILVAMARK
jgi:hypothetical protein